MYITTEYLRQMAHQLGQQVTDVNGIPHYPSIIPTLYGSPNLVVSPRLHTEMDRDHIPTLYGKPNW